MDITSLVIVMTENDIIYSTIQLISIFNSYLRNSASYQMTIVFWITGYGSPRKVAYGFFNNILNLC